MKDNIIEIGFIFPPTQTSEIDISQTKKLMEENNYFLEEVIDETYIFIKKVKRNLDYIHIGKNGEFSRFTRLIPYQKVSKTVLEGFNIWRSTKGIHSNLIEETVLPISGNNVIMIILGQKQKEYLTNFANNMWKEFADSYYGLETIQSIGLHCIIMQMNFKGSTLSDSELYHRIPLIEERYNKNELLHRIDEELELPKDDLGFNFKDATISKSALAKVLLGIQRQKYSKIE